MKKQSVFLSALLLAAITAQAQHHAPGNATPYAGLHQREIKALSADDTQRLLEGQGMSLALAAELNGYPGPLHVLEHADALRLDATQRERTQALMHSHKAEARELGARLVAAERELDRAFATRAISEAELARLTTRIGQLQAQLRAAHLRTHLQQTALLSSQQVVHYQQLRGYGQGGHR
jgi:chromosome segregation ATPase